MLSCGGVNDAREIEGNPKLQEAFDLGKSIVVTARIKKQRDSFVLHVFFRTFARKCVFRHQ